MAKKYLDENGLLYFWQKIKTYVASIMPTKQSDLTNDDYTVKDAQYNVYKGKIDTMEQRIDDIVTTGGEPNVLESVSVNGTQLQIVNKGVNLAIASGSTNGSISVNNTDVAVTGLGTAAYMNSTAFDAAGAAGLVLGTNEDTAGTATVFGALASASAAQTAANTAQSGVNAINSAGYQTATQVTTTVESYGYQTAGQVSAAISQAIGGITGIQYEIVSTLPSTGNAGVIYLISHNGTSPNIYDEYIYVNNAFEKIGTTDVDLSNYLQTGDVIPITNSEIDTITANPSSGS